MITLQKKKDKDFVVLNLTDPQLGNSEWEEGHQNRQILEYTVRELVSRVSPDLITVSGDLAWAGHTVAYEKLANFLDSFAIPWAPVWGNHDNQEGPDAVDAVADAFLQHPYCVYEKGDPALGNGNYVIAVEEEGKIVEGIFMIDSHDRNCLQTEDGSPQEVWAKLIPEQLVWYQNEAKGLKEAGCLETTMILHIPFYAYHLAAEAAYRPDINRQGVTVQEAEGAEIWQKGYEKSIGVMYEGVSCYPGEDGVFEAIRQVGSTKYVIAGHDHVNNWMIDYEGVKLIYGLKAGVGCYWNPILNGGTVLQIGSEGVKEARHEFVDVSHLLSQKEN